MQRLDGFQQCYALSVLWRLSTGVDAGNSLVLKTSRNCNFHFEIGNADEKFLQFSNKCPHTEIVYCRVHDSTQHSAPPQWGPGGTSQRCMEIANCKADDSTTLATNEHRRTA